MPNSIELIKLFIIVLVPLWLLLTKRYYGVLLWLGMTLGFEVLNATVIASVSPFQLFGLLYLPFALRQFPKALTTKVGTLIMWSLVLLAFLGLVYGYVVPWPDTSGVRPFNQRAQGRSMIYLLHTLSGLSVTIFVAQMVRRNPQSISKLIRYLLVGTTISAIGVIVAWITRVDLFAVFSPNVYTYDIFTEGRMRGLNGEPRTSGQLCAWGILLLAVFSDFRWKHILLLVHVIGFLLTMSTVGLIVLSFGLAVLIFLSPLSRQRKILSLLTITLVGGLLIQMFGTGLLQKWELNVFARLGRSGMLGAPSNFGEAIANKLEVFDASAVLFLWNNPVYLLTGTGPGLISLPASDYIQPYARSIYGDRIDSVPHMGFFLILANSGVIGLLLWFFIIWNSYSAIRRQASITQDAVFWKEGLVVFILFNILYLLQANDIWYLILGIGLGAAIELRLPYHNQKQDVRFRDGLSLYI